MACKLGWKMTLSKAECAYIFYIETNLNRLCTWTKVAYSDYAMYAYYRWELRGEISYEPHVNYLTQKERDARLIEYVNTVHKFEKPPRYLGFKRYVFCSWDRDEVSQQAYDNYLLMAECRWFARGE